MEDGMKSIKALCADKDFKTVIDMFDVAEVYESYLYICKKKKFEPLTSRTFSTMMKRNGYLIQTKMHKGNSTRKFVAK